MTRQPFRVGTRASTLAVTQTTTVAEALAAASGQAYELVRIRTEGDVVTAPLSQLGGTGVFVTALRDALLADKCDIAVHSLKDLPTGSVEGLLIAATPERADLRDALCARDGLTLATLPEGARVGTGSPRRAAQLRIARPDLQVVDIRGNVETRLARVRGNQDGPVVEGRQGDLDAVVLAAAGLNRLGRTGAVTQLLGPDVMLPAPGQGALAVECRTADALPGTALAAALAAYDDQDTRLAVLAERALLERLEAGCSAPIGALATVDGDSMSLEAVVCSTDGRAFLRRRLEAPEAGPAAALALGIALAEELLEAGAGDLAELAAR
jgi:hydroxymethylbilane synthase